MEEEWRQEALPPGQVEVQAECSLISSGTELKVKTAHPFHNPHAAVISHQAELMLFHHGGRGRMDGEQARAGTCAMAHPTVSSRSTGLADDGVCVPE